MSFRKVCVFLETRICSKVDLIGLINTNGAHVVEVYVLFWQIQILLLCLRVLCISHQNELS